MEERVVQSEFSDNDDEDNDIKSSQSFDLDEHEEKDNEPISPIAPTISSLEEEVDDDNKISIEMDEEGKREEEETDEDDVGKDREQRHIEVETADVAKSKNTNDSIVVNNNEETGDQENTDQNFDNKLSISNSSKEIFNESGDKEKVGLIKLQDKENNLEAGNAPTKSPNSSTPTSPVELDNSVASQHDKNEEQKISHIESSEDNDLLNMTEISDISMQLTGDEEAIVEDILQNASDGDLLQGGKNEEQPDAELFENISRKASAKDDDNNEEPVGAAAGELINDIFGSSDEDDEEFQGFEDDELRGTTKIKKKSKKTPEKKVVSDEEIEPEEKTEAGTKSVEEESLVIAPPQDGDSDDDEKSEESSQVFVSDFDLMMEQKREESRKARRRRKNCDIINDNDDLVAGIIKRMQEAAREDKLANEARQAATKKLKLLPNVLQHMLKIDLMVIFVDSNVLPVLKEWISPLPDGSLPHLQIREGILTILEQLPPIDSGALKVSGIGKAVMYLFRHPKETRKNKERAGKIISEWSRPIFGVTANFKSMSREEREERDYANKSKRRRLSSDALDGGKTPKRIENAIKADSKSLRPGDKGWCMRARVPAPSNKDYVVRPKSNIEYVDFTKTSKKTLNRFEKQKRKFNENKGGKKQRAVEISIEGRKMSL